MAWMWKPAFRACDRAPGRVRGGRQGHPWLYQSDHGFADKRAFDSYATLVANRYGGGATNLQACTAIDRAIKTVTADITGATLRFVATAMVAHPEMERMACALVGQPTTPGTTPGATPARPAAVGAATIAMASPAAPRPGK